jgi:hypothetical protein
MVSKCQRLTSRGVTKFTVGGRNHRHAKVVPKVPFTPIWCAVVTEGSSCGSRGQGDES